MKDTTACKAEESPLVPLSDCHMWFLKHCTLKDLKGFCAQHHLKGYSSLNLDALRTFIVGKTEILGTMKCALNTGIRKEEVEVCEDKDCMIQCCLDENKAAFLRVYNGQQGCTHWFHIPCYKVARNYSNLKLKIKQNHHARCQDCRLLDSLFSTQKISKTQTTSMDIDVDNVIASQGSSIASSSKIIILAPNLNSTYGTPPLVEPGNQIYQENMIFTLPYLK